MNTATRIHDADAIERQVGDWKDVKVLGRPPKGNTFATRDGVEYELHGRVHRSQYGDVPKPGEVWFERTEQIVEPGGRAYKDTHFIKAIQVPVGTYAARMAAAEAAERRRATQNAPASPRLFDAAELYPLLDESPSRPVLFTAYTDPAKSIMSKLPSHTMTKGQPKIRGIDAIRRWLAEQGVEFEVVNGQLIVRSRGMSQELAAILSTFKPLLLSAVVPCALQHKGQAPLAWTIAVPGIPVCRDHLGV